MLDRLFQAVFFFWVLFLLFLVFPLFSHSGSVFLFSLAGSLLAITALAYVHRKGYAFSNVFMLVCLCAACIVVFLGCMVVGSRMLVKPFNDTGSVYYAVAEIFETGMVSKGIDEYTTCAWATHTSNHDYFLIYKNCSFMVWYLLKYFRILAAFAPKVWTFEAFYTKTGLYACLVLNSASITAAMVFGFLVTRKKVGNTAALVFLLLFCGFPPYYLSAYKTYSDSLSMPYVMLSVLLYFCAEEKGDSRGILFMLLNGAALAVGALIKGSIYVLLVAQGILVFFQDWDTRKKLARAGALLAGCLAVTLAWSYCLEHSTWIDRSEAERLEFPSVHWIMMASVGDGGYRQDDFDFTASFDGLEAKKAADTEEYLRRVRAYGNPLSYFMFQSNKLAAVLSDGYYAQTVHLKRAIEEPGLLWEIVFGRYSGKLSFFLSVCCGIFYLSFLASAAAEFFRPIRSLEMLLTVSFFGLLLFFSFWEVKSRYFFNFTALFMLCTVSSWQRISEFSNKMLDLTRHIDKVRKA